MSLQIEESFQPAFLPALEEVIGRIVGLHSGIRDSDLTVCVLVDMSDHTEIKRQKNGTQVALMIAWTVHRMILTGQLIAIDCETADFSYTYLLPPDTQVKMVVPIAMVTGNQTRH